MSELFKTWDKQLEAQNRKIGRLQMHEAVVQWAVDHREELSQSLKDSLLATLEKAHGQT